MFDLYREESRIFEFCDYAALMQECRRVKAQSILEFGPGISTLALIESGAEKIVTCEYQDRFYVQAIERLKGYPVAKVIRYLNQPIVQVDGLSRRFDFAFVDSPLGVPSRGAVEHPGQEGCNRFNTMICALRHAPVVLVHDAKRDGESETLRRLAAIGHGIEMIDTRKGFARVTRKADG